MDELQDAIQDAQYMGAMADPKPRPTSLFMQVSGRQLEQFRQEQKIQKDFLAIEVVLSQPLGFYCFHRFVQLHRPTKHLKRLRFLMALRDYRLHLISRNAALELLKNHKYQHARRLINQWLQPSTGEGKQQLDLGGDEAAGTGKASGGDSGVSGSETADQQQFPSGKQPSPIAASGIQQLLSSASVKESLRIAASESAEIESFPPEDGGEYDSSMKLDYHDNNTQMRDQEDEHDQEIYELEKLQHQHSLGASSTSAGIGFRQERMRERRQRNIERLQMARKTFLTFKDKDALLGVKPILGEKIRDRLREYEKNRDGRILDTLFDEIEAYVVVAIEIEDFFSFVNSYDPEKDLPANDRNNSRGKKKMMTVNRNPVSFVAIYLKYLYIQSIPVTDADFGLYRALGRGGFGMVNGCTKRTTGKLFAMKVMNKKLIKKKYAQSLCVTERNILSEIHSPFVVCLKYAYQNPSDLVLILDLCTGGDLSFHLSRTRFTSVQVVFYAAQILLGLEAMHQHSVAYRDLKPENILLDEAGHCRISDLGLAVKVSPTLNGRCGTRGYWAPEMLVRDESGNRISYGLAVDWWSYGCVVYEMLYGKCPFRTSQAKALHEDKQKAYDIATLEMTPTYDRKYFSEEAQDLIEKLLNRDPTKRLGGGDQGAEELKVHPFFKDIDWADMEKRKLQPPFVPEKHINAASQSSIGSFETAPIKGISISDEEQKYYNDWYFINVDAYQEEIVEFLEYERKQGPISLAVQSTSCCTIV